MFLRLVGTGRIDEVRRILAAAPQMVNEIGPHLSGRAAAGAARRDRDEAARDVRQLLDAGADVNGTNDHYDHWSPLMLAINATA